MARRWGSALARWPARALWPVSDPMTGFFALRRSALEGVTFAPKGYKIAMELALRARLRTAQVPIRFEARRIGLSKMDAREVARIARHMLGLWRWRHPRAGEALCFAAVGASGFVIDLAVYLALSAAGTEHRLARALAFWPAAAWTWAWNRNVTFASLKLIRFGGHLNIAQRRCPDVEETTAVRAGVPAPDGGAGSHGPHARGAGP